MSTDKNSGATLSDLWDEPSAPAPKPRPQHPVIDETLPPPRPDNSMPQPIVRGSTLLRGRR